MQRVRDLPGWPPQWGNGRDVPVGDVSIDEVVGVTDTKVTFTGVADQKSVQLNFFAADVNTAEKVAKVLRDNRGKKLEQIAKAEVDPDGS
jgi:hypothetical protein